MTNFTITLHCHSCAPLAAQDVTKAQAKERANAQSLHNQHTLDRYIAPGSPQAASSKQFALGKLMHFLKNMM